MLCAVGRTLVFDEDEPEAECPGQGSVQVMLTRGDEYKYFDVCPEHFATIFDMCADDTTVERSSPLSDPDPHHRTAECCAGRTLLRDDDERWATPCDEPPVHVFSMVWEDGTPQHMFLCNTHVELLPPGMLEPLPPDVA